MTNLNLLKVLMFFAFPLLFFSCSDKEENASTGIDNTNVTPEMDVSCDPPCTETWTFHNHTNCDGCVYFDYPCCGQVVPCTNLPANTITGVTPPCVDCDGHCCPNDWDKSGLTFLSTPPSGGDPGYSWYEGSCPNGNCCPAGEKCYWAIDNSVPNSVYIVCEHDVRNVPF